MRTVGQGSVVAKPPERFFRGFFGFFRRMARARRDCGGDREEKRVPGPEKRPSALESDNRESARPDRRGNARIGLQRAHARADIRDSAASGVHAGPVCPSLAAAHA
jgi:hypothetical protein